MLKIIKADNNFTVFFGLWNVNCHSEGQTANWGSQNAYSWGTGCNENGEEDHIRIIVMYQIMLRQKAQGKSHVQYIMRTGCSWNILCTAVCVCNSCG